MSCLGPGYNPIPTRQWSRVENRCPTNTSLNGFVFIPLLNKNVLAIKVPSELQMLEKGNILQYKGNSSNLTQNQRYSKIAQGKWENRTTTWASQSEQVTNPNTTLLKRINVKGNILSDGTPTTLPVNQPACQPKPTIPVKTPSSNGNNNNRGPVKPPKPLPIPKPSPPYVNPFPPFIPPVVNPIVINNGGSLVCTTSVNPCTGEIINKTFVSSCNLTTASDVPGPIQELCYNGGLPTYYPRNRYKMNNSGNKWPQGVKYLRSANAIESSNYYLKQYLLNSINKSTNLNSNTQNTQINKTTDETTNETTDETTNETTDETTNETTDEFLKAYNNIIYNSNIELITTYLTNFLTGNYNVYLKNILTTTEVTTIQNNIYSLENPKYPSLTNIINIYNNILSAIYKCINECDNTIDPDLHEKYKTSDAILNNATLLNEFLSKKPSSSSTLFDVSVEAPLLEIDPIYMKYIALYGIPKDFIFDPDILASLN